MFHEEEEIAKGNTKSDSPGTQTTKGNMNRKVTMLTPDTTEILLAQWFNITCLRIYHAQDFQTACTQSDFTRPCSESLRKLEQESLPHLS